LKAATLAARLIDATHHDGNLAVGRAVHITGKLRKEPDTAISRCENGLIRARDFCKSGGIMAAALRSRLSISCRPPSRRTDAPMSPQTVPEIVFHTRVRNDALGGPNPFEWKDVSTAELFAGKNVVLFGVPGAFTPCLFGYAPAGYERHHDDFRAAGIDAVYCLSVNDAFVMFQWAKRQSIEKVFMLPDGNDEFTRLMGMLVQRSRNGMGLRSWRYSMHVKDRTILKMFAEPGFRDDPPGVGVEVSNAETMLAYLKAT
jgi:peroxiredoxin